MSEDRMRDLMRRVASMSPEPPEFPNDTPMARPAERRSAVWVFAAAGLAVVALAVPFIFFDGAPSASPQPTGPVATVPGQPVTSTPTEPVSVGWPVFLVQDPTASASGNPAVVAFYLNLIPGSDPAVLGALRTPEDVLLSLGDLPVVIPAGFSSVIPSGVRILDRSYQTTDAGVTRVTLDMSREFLAGAGGLLADVTMLNQIIFTTLQFEVHEVVFTVEGEPVEAFGMEGIVLLDPLNSQSFNDELNPIIITEPVYIDSEGMLTVRGWANVYEAAVSWQIYLGPESVPADSGHVMATCGTGCWGTFEILADLSEREGDWSSYELWVYADSALDGEPTMVVRLPFSAIAEMDRN